MYSMHILILFDNIYIYTLYICILYIYYIYMYIYKYIYISYFLSRIDGTNDNNKNNGQISTEIINSENQKI